MNTSDFVICSAEVVGVTSLVASCSSMLFLAWRTGVFASTQAGVGKDFCTTWFEFDRNNAAGLLGKYDVDICQEGCSLAVDGDQCTFEVHGSTPFKFKLGENPWASWRAASAPEKIALFGLQPAGWALWWYDRTKDVRYLEMFWNVLSDWRRRVKLEYTRSLFPWSDHTTILRANVIRFCMLVLMKHGCLSQKQHANLLRAHVRDMMLSSSDLLFDAETNHGLIMDSLLVDVLKFWPACGLRDKLLHKSARRSLGRVDHFISDDGVALEPATTYWYLIRSYYRRLEQALVELGIEVPETAQRKFCMLDKFLAETNMDGSIQRMGDSSGANRFDLPFQAPAKSDGAEIHVFDTGLLLYNVVVDGCTCLQLMINGQRIKPWVHGHQDVLGIGLFCLDEFWINSPGRYSINRNSRKRFMDSYRNQSTVYDEQHGYHAGCKFLSATETNDRIEVCYAVAPGTDHEIRRRICLGRECVDIEITDSAMPGRTAIVQWLLNPETQVLKEEWGFSLVSGSKKLRVETSSDWRIEPAFISYDRNVCQDTVLLRFSGNQVRVRIELPELNCLKTNLSVSSYYLYNKRECLGRFSAKHLVRMISLKKLLLVNVVALFGLIVSVLVIVFSR